MQKITACLWFNDQAEEAAHFYTSIFKHSKDGEITHYGAGGPRPKGSVLTVRFQLDGQEFLALNSGPHFTFTEAVSFIVHCETQEELDRMWEQLSEGGEAGQCGWLKDQYGLSWQMSVHDEAPRGDAPRCFLTRVEDDHGTYQHHI